MIFHLFFGQIFSSNQNNELYIQESNNTVQINPYVENELRIENTKDCTFINSESTSLDKNPKITPQVIVNGNENSNSVRMKKKPDEGIQDIEKLSPVLIYLAQNVYQKKHEKNDVSASSIAIEDEHLEKAHSSYMYDNAKECDSDAKELDSEVQESYTFPDAKNLIRIEQVDSCFSESEEELQEICDLSTEERMQLILQNHLSEKDTAFFEDNVDSYIDGMRNFRSKQKLDIHQLFRSTLSHQILLHHITLQMGNINHFYRREHSLGDFVYKTNNYISFIILSENIMNTFFERYSKFSKLSEAIEPLERSLSEFEHEIKVFVGIEDTILRDVIDYWEIFESNRLLKNSKVAEKIKFFEGIVSKISDKAQLATHCLTEFLVCIDESLFDALNDHYEESKIREYEELISCPAMKGTYKENSSDKMIEILQYITQYSDRQRLVKYMRHNSDVFARYSDIFNFIQLLSSEEFTLFELGVNQFIDFIDQDSILNFIYSFEYLKGSDGIDRDLFTKFFNIIISLIDDYRYLLLGKFHKAYEGYLFLVQKCFIEKVQSYEKSHEMWKITRITKTFRKAFESLNTMYFSIIRSFACLESIKKYLKNYEITEPATQYLDCIKNSSGFHTFQLKINVEKTDRSNRALSVPEFYDKINELQEIFQKIPILDSIPYKRRYFEYFYENSSEFNTFPERRTLKRDFGSYNQKKNLEKVIKFVDALTQMVGKFILE